MAGRLYSKRLSFHQNSELAYQVRVARDSATIILNIVLHPNMFTGPSQVISPIPTPVP